MEASNLNMAPAMMGNVAVWKPSTTAIHSNYFLMKVFQEAGLPDGVVNFIPGQGSVIGKVITGSRDLAGFHFTGSTSTFNTLWRQIGENLGHYKSYPKIVGETGGKNFIFAQLCIFTSTPFKIPFTGLLTQIPSGVSSQMQPIFSRI